MIGALVTTALSFGGCSTSAPPTTTVNAEPETTPTLTDNYPPLHNDEDLPGQETTYPQWDAASTAAALKTATDVMRAWGRPQLDATTWWRDLVPYLSDQAATDYAGTDPGQVPVTKVTGTPAIEDLGSPFIAVVSVPTNAGTYEVTLSRQDAAPTWVAERLTPPNRQTAR